MRRTAKLLLITALAACNGNTGLPGINGTIVVPDAQAPATRTDAPVIDAPAAPDVGPDLPLPRYDAVTSDAPLEDLCDLPPDTGPCTDERPRWFYRPSTARCEPFIFGGCGGNVNNFPDERTCDEVCRPRADGCRWDWANDAAPPDCSLCPRDRGAEGRACDTPTLFCYFGPACGATTCRCQPSDAGPLAWRCETNLCR